MLRRLGRRSFYIHAMLFAAWVMFYTVQSALVRTRKVKVHKMLGWFGLALGSAILVARRGSRPDDDETYSLKLKA